MPIIGDVSASPPNLSIDKLEVGARAYIHVDFIIVTRRAIFIDIISEVVLEEEFEMDESDKGTYLLVIRRGPHLTESDFDVIFDPDIVYDLVVDCNAIYYESMKRKDEYIIFHVFKIVAMVEVSEDAKELTLEEKLVEALKNEDYALAGKIQKQIEDEKK